MQLQNENTKYNQLLIVKNLFKSPWTSHNTKSKTILYIPNENKIKLIQNVSSIRSNSIRLIKGQSDIVKIHLSLYLLVSEGEIYPVV